MRRIRVLQVVPSFETGGAERFVVQLMRTVDRNRFEMGALSLYAKRGTELESLLNDFPVTFLDKRRGPDVRIFRKVDDFIRGFRPDVLHTHLHGLIYVLRTALSRSCPPVVHTIHSIAEREKRRIGKWLPKFLFSRSVIPVAIGEEVHDSVRRVYGVDSLLIPNGIPLDPYAAARTRREALRSELGFTPADLLFVSVGRLDQVKNHRLLIEAFAVACGCMPGAQLLLVGDGKLRRDLQARVDALGLERRIYFLGIRRDVPAVLCASDVYVFASTAEGSPLSVMEAMAAGLPIIGTAVGDIPGMVPERAGLLLPPGDGAALSEAMEALYGAPELRREMGCAALAHSVGFDMAATGEKYEALYARMAGSHSAPSITEYSLAE